MPDADHPTWAAQSGNWFLLCWNGSRAWYVGPFDTYLQAADAGASPERNTEDDPRWQLLRLDDPAAALEIVAPQVAS